MLVYNDIRRPVANLDGNFGTAGMPFRSRDSVGSYHLHISPTMKARIALLSILTTDPSF
jgi:hypothetical protein